MGFDIVLFDQHHSCIGLFELPQHIHQAIFVESAYWRSYKRLRQLSDFYRTDVTWDRAELEQFVSELEQLASFIKPEHRAVLHKLAVLLSDSSISQVHIAGD